MKPRLTPFQADPESMKALIALETHVVSSGLEQSLIELVKTRASILNGCAYCVHMHSRDARAHGESEDRLYMLSVWEESPLYTSRERAALAWTDAVTLVADTKVPDSVYDVVREEFDEAELVKLTMLVATINAWNRFGVSFRLVHPGKAPAVAA